MKIFEIDIKEGAYTSKGYEFYFKMSNWKQNKEFTKTYYINDKKNRLNKVRELLKGNNDLKSKVTVTSPKIEDWQKYNFKGFEDYLKAKQKSMFYSVWVEVGNKRKLEIEVYVETIFNKLNDLKTNFDKIDFLINQQYKEHNGIFDHEKSDFIYKEQYSGLIYDILQNKINEISNTSIEALRNNVKSTLIKPLIWKPNKNTIGTLFGVLYNNGFITGHKTDIVRGLTDMFSNLSASTLTDNVNLKINSSEVKKLYSEETIELLSEWIEYLKK
jgi:hypothetical protein